MIHLFLGGDEYLVAQRVNTLQTALGDPQTAELNVTRLDGTQTSAAELLAHASMMPFLAPRRMVIVENFLAHLDRRISASKSTESAAHGEAAQLLAGLRTLSDQCDLLFIEAKDLSKQSALWKGFTLAASDAEPKRKIDGLQQLIKAELVANEQQRAANVKTLPAWIRQRAQTKEIAIDAAAIARLASHVGPNLRLLDSELEKLAAYAGGRAITVGDIQLLVSDASEALIWDLTDAVSQRNGSRAIRSLYELRRGEANSFYLLSMIARQYRIMIKVKEAMRSGQRNENDIAKRVKESAYPVKKAMQQAQKYSSRELDLVLDRLLVADHAMKSGSDPETTIDILVAELTRKPV